MRKLLWIAFLLLIMFTSILYFSLHILVGVQTIPIEFTVGNHIGINADNDALHFGTMPPGSNGFRSIVVQNSHCILCSVEIRVNPELASWIFLSEEQFALKKGEYKEVVVYVYVPEEASYGKYEGMLSIYFKKSI